MYGATEEVWTPSDDERATAFDVLHAAERITGEKDLLYARIDMARGLDGKLAVMELELIEPYFYPEQGPDMGQVFRRGVEEEALRACVLRDGPDGPPQNGARGCLNASLILRSGRKPASRRTLRMKRIPRKPRDQLSGS
jgi:hypothetical protein